MMYYGLKKHKSKFAAFLNAVEMQNANFIRSQNFEQCNLISVANLQFYWQLNRKHDLLSCLVLNCLTTYY